MRFPPSFLDKIRARVPVSSVIGRTVQWDRRKTNASRGDYWACCPFHNEKSPSFHCEDSKGRYYCFGCRASGDIFRFLVEKEGLSFGEAVERLAGEAGLKLPEYSPEAAAREEKRASLHDVMELAAKFFETRLQSSEGATARGYLSDRSVSGAVQQDFRIGYAPAGRYDLKTHLAEHDVTPEQMVETGLIVSGDDIPVAYDRFRDRIMFPIRDLRGRVIAFGGRALSPDVPAKYLNSPEGPLFHKRSLLYNADAARSAAHKAGSINVVEGYMDVIAMTRAGFTNTVAPLGTALTEEQLTLLWRMAPEPVLCFDGDKAGIAAAYRAVDLALPMITPGHSLRFALLPDGLDPDDLLKSGGPDAISDNVSRARPMIDMLWHRALESNRRETPEARARFEVELDAAVDRISDQKVRSHYGQALRERTRALWQPERRSFQPRRDPFQGRAGAGRQRFRPRFGDRPWAAPAPASAELRSLAGGLGLERAGERRESAILISLVNHPGLMDRMAELVADIELRTPGLDNLRRHILDISAVNERLDSAALRAQLVTRGHGTTLMRADEQARRLDTWFAMSDAAEEDVLTGLKQMLALHRKAVTLSRELAQAQQQLAELPNEENLIHLNEIREQLHSTANEEASVDGFGEASGRGRGT